MACDNIYWEWAYLDGAGGDSGPKSSGARGKLGIGTTSSCMLKLLPYELPQLLAAGLLGNPVAMSEVS